MALIGPIKIHWVNDVKIPIKQYEIKHRYYTTKTSKTHVAIITTENSNKINPKSPKSGTLFNTRYIAD